MAKLDIQTWQAERWTPQWLALCTAAWCVVLGASGQAWAGPAADPTRPPEQWLAKLAAEAAGKPDGAGGQAGLSVQGGLGAPDAEPPQLPPPEVAVTMIKRAGERGQALIDGQWRKPGDELQQWRIVRIDPMAVTFAVNKQVHTVPMLVAQKNRR